MYGDGIQKGSTLFGMLLVVIVQFQNDEVLKTLLLAGLGGASSYLCSYAVKFLIFYIRNRLKKK